MVSKTKSCVVTDLPGVKHKNKLKDMDLNPTQSQ